VLINRYEPGDGIFPHADGPAYFPKVAILSLLSAVSFDFWSSQRFEGVRGELSEFREQNSEQIHSAESGPREHRLSVLLPKNSVLFFQNEAYTEWTHGIRGRKAEDFDVREASNSSNPTTATAVTKAEEEASSSSASAYSAANAAADAAADEARILSDEASLGLSRWSPDHGLLQRGLRYSLTIRYVEPA